MDDVFHGVMLGSRSSPIIPADLSTPDFSTLSLLIEPFPIENGLGVGIPLVTVLTNFQAELAAVVDAIKNGTPVPPLFVPDLWHVTRGDVKLFTREEGHFLHNSQVFATLVARQFITERSEPESRQGYPGMLYKSD